MAGNYDPAREQRRWEAEQERLRRTAERERKAAQAAQRAAHLQAQTVAAEQATARIDARMRTLNNLLVEGLRRATLSNPQSLLRRSPALPRLNLGSAAHSQPAPTWEAYAPPAPGWLRRTFSSGAVSKEEQDARLAYERACHEHAGAEHARLWKVTQLTRAHQADCQRIVDETSRANRALDALVARAAQRDKDAVEQLQAALLSHVPLPDDFPRDVQVIFDSSAEHIVIEAELPAPACVPEVRSVRYVQSRDQMESLSRPRREQAESYRHVVAQVCLLVLRTMFTSDQHVTKISLNGRVRHVNPATGQRERPHIISIVVERHQLDAIALAAVQPVECLKHLRALVSPHPAELEAVEPLVDFDRSRLAFVDGLAVVAGLDARPDLMQLSPTEFEHLIRELFDADSSVESIESLVTRQSNDGGIDGVIYTKQALGRSMTVVQVKQYARNRSLGPAHVRELIGAIHEARASNGLLVTTSRFTATATANASEFGRMELIDGSNLVFLIKQRLGKDVLIGDRSSPR